MAVTNGFLRRRKRCDFAPVARARARVWRSYRHARPASNANGFKRPFYGPFYIRGPVRNFAFTAAVEVRTMLNNAPYCFARPSVPISYGGKRHSASYRDRFYVRAAPLVVRARNRDYPLIRHFRARENCAKTPHGTGGRYVVSQNYALVKPNNTVVAWSYGFYCFSFFRARTISDNVRGCCSRGRRKNGVFSVKIDNFSV